MTKTAIVHAQQMWEYQELTRKSAEYLTGELNDLGQQGWELVSVMQGLDRKKEVAWVAFIKRPYVPQSSPPAQTATAESAPSAPIGTRAAHSQAAIEAALSTGGDDEFKLRDLEDAKPKPPQENAPPDAEEDVSKNSS